MDISLHNLISVVNMHGFDENQSPSVNHNTKYAAYVTVEKLGVPPPATQRLKGLTHAQAEANQAAACLSHEKPNDGLLLKKTSQWLPIRVTEHL